MSKTIVMQDTACGPDGNFYAGQKYQVGMHISKAQADAFVSGRHAAYVDEAVAAKTAPETDAKKETATDKQPKETATDKKAEGSKK